MRRLKHRLGPRDVLLFTDWTLLRLYPPLRAMWAKIGTPAKVCITGHNARRVLFGTINVKTAHRTVHMGRGVIGAHRLPPCWVVATSVYQAGPPSTRMGSFLAATCPARSL